MRVFKAADKTYCQFGHEYIKGYVAQHQKDSPWNDTQFTLIVETFVNFIDSYAEAFMKKGFPGDPVWVFEQLLAINTYVQKNGCRGGDQTLKTLEEPLFQFQDFMKKTNPQGIWLVPPSIINLISKPHQFMLGWYDELDLPRYSGYCYSPAHIESAHALVDDLLQLAIKSIKETEAYRSAATAGKLHYYAGAHLKEKEAKNSPISSASLLSAGPSLLVEGFSASSKKDQSKKHAAENGGESVERGFSVPDFSKSKDAI